MRIPLVISSLCLPVLLFQPLAATAQTLTPQQQIAAAVLPLPEAQRAGATVVAFGPDQKPVVLRQGSNGFVCSADRPGNDVFQVDCFHERVQAVLNREVELSRQMKLPSNDPAVRRALDQEIKAGTLTLPPQPTIGFRMRGPLASYDAATNTVKNDVTVWQMVIVPYTTGESLGLPTQPTGSMRG
jgi:hypothetical protein